MLKVTSLKKSYGDVRALRGISFSIQRGEIFGLLGPNGAGKTTAISIMSSLLAPDEGTIAYEGKDVLKNTGWWRQKIGIVPQEMAFYEELTGRENLMLWAALYGIRGRRARGRTRELFDMMGLEAKIDRKVSTYSGGMKRRLNIALGVVHQPKVLFLDEPTVGIDVQARLKIRRILGEFAQSGMSMVYTTHQMEEAQKTCHRLAIIDEGKIRAAGTLPELVALLGEGEVLHLQGKFPEEAVIQAIARREQGVELLGFSPDRLRLACDREDRIPGLIEAFISGGIRISSIDIRRPDLETLFVKLTGKELREE